MDIRRAHLFLCVVINQISAALTVAGLAIAAYRKRRKQLMSVQSLAQMCGDADKIPRHPLILGEKWDF
jgi:hypothetical protein